MCHAHGTLIEHDTARRQKLKNTVRRAKGGQHSLDKNPIEASIIGNAMGGIITSGDIIYKVFHPWLLKLIRSRGSYILRFKTTPDPASGQLLPIRCGEEIILWDDFSM
jgi:hypothetical protein